MEITEMKLCVDWRKVNNEDLCNVYASLNIIMAIKPRKMYWVEHAYEGHEKCIKSSQKT